MAHATKARSWISRLMTSPGAQKNMEASPTTFLPRKARSNSARLAVSTNSEPQCRKNAVNADNNDVDDRVWRCAWRGADCNKTTNPVDDRHSRL